MVNGHFTQGYIELPPSDEKVYNKHSILFLVVKQVTQGDWPYP